jgi:hypothetical protein
MKTIRTLTAISVDKNTFKVKIKYLKNDLTLIKDIQDNSYRFLSNKIILNKNLYKGDLVINNVDKKLYKYNSNWIFENNRKLYLILKGIL